SVMPAALGMLPPPHGRCVILHVVRKPRTNGSPMSSTSSTTTNMPKIRRIRRRRSGGMRRTYGALECVPQYSLWAAEHVADTLLRMNIARAVGGGFQFLAQTADIHPQVLRFGLIFRPPHFVE